MCVSSTFGMRMSEIIRMKDESAEGKKVFLSNQKINNHHEIGLFINIHTDIKDPLNIS